MDFETALAVIAGVFLLLGLLGRVEIQRLRLGTENKVARGISVVFGMILLLIALRARTDLFRPAAQPPMKLQSDTPEPTASVANHYFVIVNSTLSESDAVAKAEVISTRGFSAEVYKSTTGYFAVAVRAESKAAQPRLYEDLRKAGLAPADAFFSAGERFERKVYPR